MPLAKFLVIGLAVRCRYQNTLSERPCPSSWIVSVSAFATRRAMTPVASRKREKTSKESNPKSITRKLEK